jgi:uncharacterized protein
MTHETVLVTGASSGIGRELSHCFAADGSRLILLARRGGALQAVAEELRRRWKVDVRVLVQDLADPETPVRVIRHLQEQGLKVDVLVNNAGFGLQGRFGELPMDRQLAMVQVNMVALTHLTRLLLPEMRTRRRGGVLNVTSLAGFQPGPHMAIYYATKAYVLSLSEALAEEAVGTGVVITALCPGPTETGFAEVARMKDTHLWRMNRMSAREVAESGHRAFRRGRVVEVPGWWNRVLLFPVRILPRAWVRKVVGWLNRNRGI